MKHPRMVAFTTAAALTAAGALIASPAAGTPPLAPATTYTVTMGATGSNPVVADSPSSPYIDKDGTFYTQQSTALYGATDTRVWAFKTGTDIDHLSTAAIANSADPANSQDNNNNTTWRCNNSPTGLSATVSTGSAYPELNYCDLIGTWVDPDTGNWIGLVHDEFTGAPFNDGMHYDSIDYAVSTDQGHTWKITGHAITSPYSTTRMDTAAFPNQTYYFGDGDQRLFVDIASGYFYVYYSSMIVNKSGGYVRHEHVARAPISGKMATGTWQKWYNGTWTENGVGGKESNIVPAVAASDTGYTPPANEWKPTTTGTGATQISAGTMPDESALLYMSVTYDAYLGLYIAEAKPFDRTDNLKLPMPIFATDDLFTQKWFKIGDTGSVNYGSYWYHWFIDANSKTSGTIVGKTFREYCDFNCPSGSPEWRSIALDSTTPAVPVDTGRTYQIAGNGLALTAVNGQQTVSTVATGSAGDLAQWSFRPLGDGSYAIENNATGSALAVPSTPAGRAWGTQPVVAIDDAATTVAEQWFVVPVRTASSQIVPGSFKLVNRYSGLVLALSSAHSAETTPARAWTDATGSGVGAGRAALEQTIGLTPVNLAFHKASTDSSHEGGSVGPGYAVDGAATYTNGQRTYWGAGPLPQWWEVDLGRQYNLSHINVTNYVDGNRYYDYTVDASADGRTWTTIATKSNTAVATAAGDDYPVNGTARYIRITVTHNSANTSGHLVDVVVDGTAVTDLARSKAATAQSDEGTTFAADKAVDGSAPYLSNLSYWGAGPLPQWWQVDLGSAYSLSSVSITNYADGVRYYQYTVEGSTDGTTWSTLAQKADNTVATWQGDIYPVTGVARYIRVTVTYNSANTSGHLSNVTIR
ncbi:discoidin domain-containing protein [Leifsonia sp. McL0607]|uniref:galactose-binding domain-containing protein n=1 Tax=Leifsonia sp. McL0607 TaxID=3415672 RepID=UPI003CE82551